MANAETRAVVEVEVRIAASPETVFDFLVDPEKLTRWMGRSARLDPQPGGEFHCDMNGANIAGGKYLEIEPPSRAVFTWGWEGEGVSVAPGASTVEIRLEPDGDGTHLRLIHSDLPTTESAEKHEHGWGHYLARLTTAAGGGDPGPDPWATPEGAPGVATD